MIFIHKYLQLKITQVLYTLETVNEIAHQPQISAGTLDFDLSSDSVCSSCLLHLYDAIIVVSYIVSVLAEGTAS